MLSPCPGYQRGLHQRSPATATVEPVQTGALHTIELVQDVTRLPGGDIFVEGVEDLRRGGTTEASLLVSLARTRLVQAGLTVPPGHSGRPAHELYDMLAARHGDDAHGRYNALLRRIASFARAAEHAASS